MSHEIATCCFTGMGMKRSFTTCLNHRTSFHGRGQCSASSRLFLLCSLEVSEDMTVWHMGASSPASNVWGHFKKPSLLS